MQAGGLVHADVQVLWLGDVVACELQARISDLGQAQFGLADARRSTATQDLQPGPASGRDQQRSNMSFLLSLPTLLSLVLSYFSPSNSSSLFLHLPYHAILLATFHPLVSGYSKMSASRS